MTRPGETQNQPSDQPTLPERTAAASAERPGVAVEKGTHRLGREHLRDNVEFLDALDQGTEEEKKKSLEQIAKWQQEGDIDLLRAAGLSLEQIQKNPLDRHIRLASALLKRDARRSGLVFWLDLGDNENLQWDLDLTDILPPNNLTVDLCEKSGKLICAGAVRDFRDGRPGYFHPRSGERIQLVDGMGITIRQTQSSMALRDPVYGHQTSLQAKREEAFMIKNAQKTVVKEHARAKAAEQGQELKTDRSFFDVFLEDITNTINSTGLADSKNPLKIDFGKLEQEILKLLESFGFAKMFSDLGKSLGLQDGTTSGNESASSSPSGTAEKSRTSPSYRESHESRNTPKINRQWLRQYVGSNEREVQTKLVPINFLGANMRVCKYIAPYLKEAEIRARNAGIDYRADPRRSGGVSWRPVTGQSQTLSMHSWGVAVDINPLTNPYQRQLSNDPNGRNKVKTDMPPAFIAIMQDVGFMHLWWDPMHFELQRNPFLNRGVLKSEEAKALGEKYLPA